MALQLSEIFIYPIKSLGGISLNSSFAGERGLKYDRRYLLVDEDGIFITQRDYPQMALLKLSICDDGFRVLNKQDNSQLIVPFEAYSTEKLKVQIWDDICAAIKVSSNFDNWFSAAINKKCSLVYMPETERRIVDKERKYVDDEHLVSFADGYPFLIIGQSSLDDLNKRLASPVPINRFRPNFVFTGGDAFEEDNWKDFFIGNLKFRAVKPCDRCVITTTDQETAERNEEPLKTLSTFRKFGNKVLFGMNVISSSTGVVLVGDKINLKSDY